MRTNLSSLLGFGLGATTLLASAQLQPKRGITAVKWTSGNYTISGRPVQPPRPHPAAQLL